MSRPATRTTPELGGSRPPRICSSVVLPEPEAPTIATRSPAATLNATPRSTSSTTGPWWKLLCTACASSTGSLMAQRLRGRGTRRPPRRINGGEHAQRERYGAHPQDVAELDVRGKIAHVVDACVEELRAKEPLEPRHQCLQIVGEQRAERRAGKGTGEADEHPLHGKSQQHVARCRTERAQDGNVRLLLLHDHHQCCDD